MNHGMAVASCIVAVSASAGRADVSSPYYLFNSALGAASAQVVSGASIVNSWSTYSSGLPVAVTDSIRPYHIGPQFPGRTDPGPE